MKNFIKFILLIILPLGLFANNINQLIRACDQGDLRIAKALLEAGMDCNSPNLEGELPLFAAIMHPEIVSLLLEKGADMDQMRIYSDHRSTLLEAAITYGEESLIFELMNRGVKMRKTTLITAVLGGRESVVKRLLSEGFDPNWVNDNGLTALGYAASEKQLSFCELLIKSGGNPTFKDLELACMAKENSPCIGLLLSSFGEDQLTHTDKVRLLHLSIQNQPVELVEKFISLGADIEVRDDQRRSSLLMALALDHEAIAQLLLEKGANPNVYGGYWKATPLHYAVAINSLPLVHKLINEHSVSANVLDTEGKTPLFYVETKEMINLLLDNGADINHQNIDGNGLLHLTYDDELVRIFLERGAKVNLMNNENFTPLHINESLDVLTRLLQNGAEVNQITPDGQTPLFYAVSRWNESKARFFLERGADPYLSEKAGWPSLKTLCLDSNGRSLRRLLAEYGVCYTHSDVRALHGYEICLNVDLIDLWLQGQDINERLNPHGDTLLSFAAIHGNRSLVQKLLNLGADPKLATNGYHPLTAGSDLEIVKMLYEHGAKVSEKSLIQCWTKEIQSFLASKMEGMESLAIFHKAIELDNIELVKKYIDKGYDLNVSSGYDFPSSIFRCSSYETLELLLQAGADPNVTYDDQTLLVWMASSGDLRKADLLLKYGADINKGSPLCSASDLRMIDFLLKRGADPSVRNSQGLTPLTVYVENNEKEAAAMLIEWDKGASRH